MRVFEQKKVFENQSVSCRLRPHLTSFGYAGYG